MKCYFDGSDGTDDSGTRWLTLAGFMGSDAFWRLFHNKWERMLRERYPIAPYIHMYELLSGDDPFERAVGWTEERIHKLIFDALDVLQYLDKNRFRAVVCSIDVTAHRELASEAELSEPAVICAHTCIYHAFSWYVDTHPSVELASVFFDQDEPFIRPIREQWRKHYVPRNRVTVEPFWGLLENVQAVGMKEHLPIQAADMMAWARTRSLSERHRPWRYLAEVMRQIIPHTTVILDGEYLRAKHGKRV